MELRINGKTMENWSLEEMQVIINESEMYRENEYLDYKKNFAFLECVDKDIKKKKKMEFCNDVCAFANSEDGYLFFGIEEERGEPKALIGIEISDGDTDRFELDRRNELSWIQPIVPVIKFKFIPIEEKKYIVVLYVEKGVYSPYVCRKPNEAYSFYVRNGNRKRIMDYREVELMFKFANSLSSAIKEFVEERIEILRHYNLQDTYIETKGIAVLHIVPDNFQRTTEISKMFRKEKDENVSFSRIFNGFCYGRSMPFVDGLMYNNVEYNNGIRVRIYNNGIVELSLDLDKYTNSVDKLFKEQKRLTVGTITEKFADFSRCYIDNCNTFTSAKRVYLCASIMDAEGILTEINDWNECTGYISDVYNLCPAIELYDVRDEDAVNEAINNLITVICLACGIKKVDRYLE